MKTIQRMYGPMLAVGILSFSIFYSCEKERVPQDDYQDMDSFYNDNKEDEQEYEIDSLGSSCWVTCNKGTRICTSAPIQEFPGGAPVYYTYFLKVVELYSAKDMILWRAPSITADSVLETSAAIRVRLVKNNTETQIKAGMVYGLETANLGVIQNDMTAHYGFTNGSNINWTYNLGQIYPGFVDNLSSVTPTGTYYTAAIPHTGFWCASRPYPATNGLTSIAFTATGTNTNKIQTFLVFTNYKAIAKAENMTASNLPIGEPAVMIAFGKKNNGNYYMDQQNITITANMTVTLNMVQTTESGILAALDAL